MAGDLEQLIKEIEREAGARRKALKARGRVQGRIRVEASGPGDQRQVKTAQVRLVRR